jgi:ribulose-5-phosphate 4-epimerase/fuculose-1-phosphate aldolase
MVFQGEARETTHPVLTPPAFTNVEDERRHRKARLAAAYRIYSRLGYDHWVTGHITVRDPEFPDQFWVNPFPMSWHEIHSSDLLLVDSAGEVVCGDWPVNGAAFAVHAAVHRSRPDVIAVAHAHTPYGQAWAATGRPIEAITQDACAFYGDHAIFDGFSGVVYDAEEGNRLARALGGNKALVLRHHGLLTVGRTVDEAAFWLHLLEKVCQTHLLLAATMPGAELPTIDPTQAGRTHDQVGQSLHGWLGFQPLWAKIISEEPDLLD